MICSTTNSGYNLGKSLSLLYFLVRRLSEKLPTAYQRAPGYYFFFTSEGVKRLNDNDPPPEIVGTQVWALTDSNQSLSAPSGGFSLSHTPHFLIQASSPNQTRYKAWTKERGAVFAMMDVWSWEEMKKLMYVARLHSRTN